MSVQHIKIDMARLRRLVLVTLLFMVFGTALELYLIDHYEDRFQLIPLLFIALCLLLVIVLLFKNTEAIKRIFKLVLALTALSGVYGTFLHLKANFEFEKEMTPTAGNWDLFVESLSSALPALAPCSMIVLALIGYSHIILLKQKK